MDGKDRSDEAICDAPNCKIKHFNNTTYTVSVIGDRLPKTFTICETHLKMVPPTIISILKLHSLTVSEHENTYRSRIVLPEVKVLHSFYEHFDRQWLILRKLIHTHILLGENGVDHDLVPAYLEMHKTRYVNGKTWHGTHADFVEWHSKEYYNEISFSDRHYELADLFIGTYIPCKCLGCSYRGEDNGTTVKNIIAQAFVCLECKVQNWYKDGHKPNCSRSRHSIHNEWEYPE